MFNCSNYFASAALAGAVITATALSSGGPAAAAGTADFYKGKNVSIYVGFFPGGGYDTYARALGSGLID